MEKEEYTIGMVKGFVVAGHKYYSKVFNTIEEAKEHQKKIEATPKREQTETRSYPKPKEKK